MPGETLPGHHHSPAFFVGDFLKSFSEWQISQLSAGVEIIYHIFPPVISDVR